jgi:hypothetical protein
MNLPVVTLYRDETGRLRRCEVDGHELQVSGVQVNDEPNGLPRVTLTFPAAILHRTIGDFAERVADAPQGPLHPERTGAVMGGFTHRHSDGSTVFQHIHSDPAGWVEHQHLGLNSPMTTDWQAIVPPGRLGEYERLAKERSTPHPEAVPPATEPGDPDDDVPFPTFGPVQGILWALETIAAPGCENFTTGPGSCLRENSGKTIGAPYGADSACGACIAYGALEKWQGTS